MDIFFLFKCYITQVGKRTKHNFRWSWSSLCGWRLASLPCLVVWPCGCRPGGTLQLLQKLTTLKTGSPRKTASHRPALVDIQRVRHAVAKGGRWKTFGYSTTCTWAVSNSCCLVELGLKPIYWYSYIVHLSHKHTGVQRMFIHFLPENNFIYFLRVGNSISANFVIFCTSDQTKTRLSKKWSFYHFVFGVLSILLCERINCVLGINNWSFVCYSIATTIWHLMSDNHHFEWLGQSRSTGSKA